jgi:hypothetical protein
MNTRMLIINAEQSVVGAAIRTAQSEGPAIDLLRNVIADAAARKLAIHRYSTNGNRNNGGNWIRTYAAHSANKPRPRLSRHCDGPFIRVNRESAGVNSKFFRNLQELRERILAKPVTMAK